MHDGLKIKHFVARDESSAYAGSLSRRTQTDLIEVKKTDFYRIGRHGLQIKSGFLKPDTLQVDFCLTKTFQMTKSIFKQ